MHKLLFDVTFRTRLDLMKLIHITDRKSQPSFFEAVFKIQIFEMFVELRPSVFSADCSRKLNLRESGLKKTSNLHFVIG